MVKSTAGTLSHQLANMAVQTADGIQSGMLEVVLHEVNNIPMLSGQTRQLRHGKKMKLISSGTRRSLAMRRCRDASLEPSELGGTSFQGLPKLAMWQSGYTYFV